MKTKNNRMIAKESIRFVILIILSFFVFYGCSTKNYVKARIWETPYDQDKFPEINGPLAVPWLKNKPSFGIAFSGGGTRSAAATVGQLRALERIGLLDKARYISVVSGGSWAVIPYIYLPETYDDSSFLGTYYKPDQLYDKRLTRYEKNTLADLVGDVGFIGTKILTGFILLKGDETYSRAIGKEFLNPLGLYGNMYFTFHKKALDNILLDNKNLDEKDFTYIKKRRPYPIIGATLLDPWKGGKPENIYPLEITPLYTGIRGDFVTKGKEKRELGGGYVESFAYDSKPTKENLKSNGRRQRFDIGLKRHRFTLSDAIGTSGAAPVQTLSRIKIHKIGFPEFRYWPVSPNKVVDFKETSHGDGGHLDNLGIMPLLVRQVEKIIVFINTPTPFIAEKINADIDQDVISDDILGLFGKMNCKFPHNKIFKNGDQELEILYSKLQEKKDNNQPLVYIQRYSIVDNTRFGIKGNKPDGSDYEPIICWVYLDRNEKWIKQLYQANPDDDTVNKIRFRKSPFENFPHYHTFFDRYDQVQVIDLDAKPVNAISQMTSWTIIESRHYIEKELFHSQ